MPRAHTASRDAESCLQGWARQAALLVGKSPCVSESFLCNSVDLAAFAFLAVEEVTWKALSSSNVTLELGPIMLQCSNKLQLWLGNFEMSCALSGSFRVYVPCLTETSASSPAAPPRGTLWAAAFLKYPKSLGMEELAALLSVCRENHPKLSNKGGNSDCCEAPGFSSNSETLG